MHGVALYENREGRSSSTEKMSQADSDRTRKTNIEQDLKAWFSTGLGERIATGEREAIAVMAADLFGYRLLQMGELGDDMGHLDGCPVRRKLLLTQRPDAAADGVIVGAAGHLPVASDCLDAVVLAHTLDFSPEPHRVLREVERVLIAEGRVIIVGFNPFSLWGVWRLFVRWRGGVPWTGQFLSYPRLNDWLTLMGFDIERMDVMEFRPPTRRWRFDGIERLGRRFWPMLAGVYVVRAVKRVSRVTPLRQRWARLRVVEPRAIEPTAREIKDA
jgi:SAM-dependent methyltransferase